MSELVIVHVLPHLLGTYGDAGNAMVLAHRARARGQRVRVIEVHPGDLTPAQADLYLLGGGEDAEQVRASELLRVDDGLASAVRRGAPVLAVCAGMQLMGEWFLDRIGQRLPGLGILDLRTTRREERAVGDMVARVVGIPGMPDLVGFENHQGATELGERARPLADVGVGVGNGAGAPIEGVVAGSVVGTYLHGPVLALNPMLADHLLAAVLGPLEPLPDVAVEEFRSARLQRAGVKPG